MAVGTVLLMPDHKWAPREPGWISRLRFEQVGELKRAKALTVSRSGVAVFVEIAWQVRLQRAWVPRETVTDRKPSSRRD